MILKPTLNPLMPAKLIMIIKNLWPANLLYPFVCLSAGSCLSRIVERKLS